MTSPLDRVLTYVFRLQQEAWTAIDDGWPDTLPGKRVPQDEKQLRWFIEQLPPALDDLEACLSPRLNKSDRRDHLYASLHLFIAAAHFIGSRGRMSMSQKNYFASMQGAAAGRRSAAKRSEIPPEWKRHALELAQKVRAINPKLSQARTATAILRSWRLSRVTPPEHRTIRDYISALEKSGSLPTRR